MNFIDNFINKFHSTLIEKDRWLYLLDGLKTTLIITFFAVILGMVLGFLIAIVRSTHDKTGKLGFLNVLARIYLTVIRGTPVVVQLLIIYFVLFASVNVGKTFVAVLAFGLNSAAYVAEIVRSGIMSIDNGQFEASASLGLNYPKTLLSVILPQAFKNVLPALANECIVLLKGCRLYCGDRPDQGRRYYPKPDLRGIPAADRSCPDLSDHGHDLEFSGDKTGKEIGEK